MTPANRQAPQEFKEQGNVVMKLLGTSKHKENKAGNTETKNSLSEFLETKIHRNKKKILAGNKGTQGEFCCEQGNTDVPERPLTAGETYKNAAMD